MLKEAFRLSWKYKYLWFFGLFAALVGSSGVLNVFVQIFASSGDNYGFVRLAEVLFSGQFFDSFPSLLSEGVSNIILFLLIIAFILILVLFVAWVALVSQTALISNSGLLNAGKMADFKSGLEKGVEKFWPILGLNALLKVFLLAGSVLVGMPYTLGIDNPVLMAFVYIVLFIIFLPIAVSMSFIIKYAMAYVVLKNKAFKESIMDAWTMFSKNWLVSLEMAFALFLIDFLFSLFIIFLILIFVAPIIFIALLASQTSALAFSLIILFAFLIALVLMAVFRSVMTVFQVAAWTDLFVKLGSEGFVSKLVRISTK